jgi:hypothetical protein
MSIVGTEIVKVAFEKCQNIEFETKDSSGFASFYKIIIICLFMSDTKDSLE